MSSLCGNVARSLAAGSLKSEIAYRVLDASGKVLLSSAAGDAFWATSDVASRLQRGRFEFEHAGVAMRPATE